MTKNRGQLLACQPDGSFRLVPNSYEGIKDGLNQATLDFIGGGEAGLYVDDEGMLTDQPLNVPASLLFGMALYGPVVLCAGQPDDEGDTLPASNEAMKALMSLAEQWRRVAEDGERKGQSLVVRPNSGTIPPATITALTDEEFDRWLGGGES